MSRQRQPRRPLAAMTARRAPQAAAALAALAGAATRLARWLPPRRQGRPHRLRRSPASHRGVGHRPKRAMRAMRWRWRSSPSRRPLRRRRLCRPRPLLSPQLVHCCGPEAAPDLYASARQGSEPAEPRAGMCVQPERAGSPAADADEHAVAAAAVPPEPEAAADEELSELEEEEAVAYLHQPEEVELRKVIWEELNREYTEQQEAKQRAADAAAAKARTLQLSLLPP